MIIFFFIIAVNMYLVYMAEHNNTVARHINAEVHTMKDNLSVASEEDAISSRERVAVSHLVIAEPVTVSVSLRQ